MLILKRDREQSVVIGDDVEVTVVRLGSDGVHLGITAPRAVPVHRKEIAERLRAEGRRHIQSHELTTATETQRPPSREE